MAAANSGALYSAPAVTIQLSVCRGLDAPGAGPLSCSAWGKSVLAVLGPPGLWLSQGEVGSWTVSLSPCVPRPALLDSRTWPRSPLRGAAAGAPPSCSWVQPCALQPLGSSVHSPGGTGVC